MFLRRAFLLLLPALAARAEDFEIYSFRQPCVLKSGNVSSPPVNTQKLKGDEVLVVGSGGSLALSGEQGTIISVIGPGHLRLEKSKIIFDYGDIFFQGGDDSDAHVQGPGFSLEAEDNKFYVELGTARELTRLRNVGDALQVEGQEVASGRTFYRNQGLTQILPTDSADLDWHVQRHENNRQLKQLDEPLEKLSQDNSLRYFVEGGYLTGLTSLLPRQGSTFVQDVGGIGIFATGGFKIFLKSVPRRRQRNFYLYSPALRFGLQMGALFNNIKPKSTTTDDTYIFHAMASLGFSWVGVFADGQFGYQSVFGAEHRFSVPFGWKLDMGYRFDLKELTTAEMGFALGATFRQSAMVPRTGSSVVGVNPDNFSWRFIGLFGSVATRF
jgi:hypothetical protein